MQLSFSFQYFDSAVIIAKDRKTCSRLETNIISKIVIFLVSRKFMSGASKTNKISGLSPFDSLLSFGMRPIFRG